MVELRLNEIAGGALQAKVNAAFAQILQNMHDPNTQYKPKRKLTLEITFEQDEERTQCNCNATVKTKLADSMPIKQTFYSGVDLETGEVVLSDYGQGIKGQMGFADVGITREEIPQNVDPETGEILEKPVIDFRERRQA